jgi:PAS domain S-box-containing protein
VLVSETARLVTLAAPSGAGNVLLAVAIVLGVALAVNLFLDALFLRRRRHWRELAERDSRLGAAAELSAALAQAGDRKSAATIVLDTLNELVGFDFSGLMLLDEGGRVARGLAARAGGTEVDWYPSVRVDLERTTSGARHAIESREVYTVEDTAASGELRHELIERARLKSVVYLPLESERGIFGVVVAGSTTGLRDFRPEQLSLMKMLAAGGSLALGRMESLEALEHALERERQVAEISRRVRAELDLDRLLDATLAETAKVLGVSRCLVRLGEPGGETRLRAEWNRADLDPVSESVVPYLAASRLALAELETVAIADVERDPRLEGFSPEGRQILLSLGSRATMSSPIVLFDRVIGALTVHASEPRRWSDDEVAFLEAIAREIGVALHTGGLIEENERRLEEHKALLAATEAMTDELELDTVLAQRLAGGRSDLMGTGTSGEQAVRSEAVRQAVSLLEADAALIFDLEGNELVAREGKGEGLEEMYGRRFPAAISLAGDLVHSRKPLVISDLLSDQGNLGVIDPIVGGDFKALVGVPLAGVDDALTGVLVVYSRRPRMWRSKEVDALLTLAANTATALTGAALYLRVSLEREQSMAILSSVADGIVAVDRSDRIVLWNAAAERITGIASGEALGQLAADVLRHEDAAVEESGERSFLFKRGSREAWLQVSEATMLDPSGQTAGKIYTLRDISADRFVEQAKSDFVSLVSHELRAPLTSIYGFAETLLRRNELFDETQRRTFLSYIARESERLTGIVDALLNVAELDSGDLQVELAATDVSSLVREVVESARNEAEQNGPIGHRFVVDLPDEPLSADADRDKLRRVLSNLVDNAVKFSPSGGTVTVSGQKRPGSIELRVADEGVGIPEQERERIFRKFYRGSSSVLSSGTGLGLFITRGLVTAMGGRIWVDSTEGEGSVFALELPSGKETQEPPE